MTKALHTTSSASMQSFGNTGAAYATPSTGGWNSLSTTKTASFSTIQEEINQAITYSPGHTYKAYNPVEVATQALYTEQPHGPRRSIEFPGGGTPPTGQTDPSFASPIGEPLFPILLLACLYTIGRCLASYIRKLKSANSLKS